MNFYIYVYVHTHTKHYKLLLFGAKLFIQCKPLHLYNKTGFIFYLCEIYIYIYIYTHIHII